MSVFEDFRKNEEEDVVSDAQASEKHQYVFVRPNKENLTAEYSVTDLVTEQGHEKLVTTQILECGCGCLVSWDPESRLKPPAGRCQNESCRSLVCQRHLDELSQCQLCGVQICLACRIVKNDNCYCKSCWEASF